MMATNHLGTPQEPVVHPVVASAAREVLNKSENERSGVLSTAMSFLGLYRDPTVAATTSACDWRLRPLHEPPMKDAFRLTVKLIHADMETNGPARKPVVIGM